MQKLGGLIIGTFIVAIVIAGLQIGAHLAFDLPDEVTVRDYGKLLAYRGMISPGAFYSVPIGWVLAAFIGSYVSTKVGKDLTIFSSSVIIFLVFGLATYVLSVYPLPGLLWPVIYGSIAVAAVVAGRLALLGYWK